VGYGEISVWCFFSSFSFGLCMYDETVFLSFPFFFLFLFDGWEAGGMEKGREERRFLLLGSRERDDDDDEGVCGVEWSGSIVCIVAVELK